MQKFPKQQADLLCVTAMSLIDTKNLCIHSSQHHDKDPAASTYSFAVGVQDLKLFNDLRPFGPQNSRFHLHRPTNS